MICAYGLDGLSLWSLSQGAVATACSFITETSAPRLFDMAHAIEQWRTARRRRAAS